MSDSSQIGNAERSAAIFYYKNKLNENKDNILRHEADPYIVNWRTRKGEYLLERGEIYEKLHELGEYDKPLDTISAQVTDDLVSWGLEADIEGRHVRRVLPEKYKNKSQQRFGDSNTGGQMSADPQKVKETIKVISGTQFLETVDNEGLRDLHQRRSISRP